MQSINIYEGKLLESKLAFQLYDEAGEPVSLTYRGEGFIQGNKLRIIMGRSTVYDYTVASHPTPESGDYLSGYEKGKSQKRRRLPAEYSSAWYHGWLVAWEEK